MNEEGLGEKFAESANIKRVFRRAVHPTGFGLVHGSGDIERRGMPPSHSPEIYVLKLPSMAQNQLVNGLAEA
jgi:hypothetical protein